MTVGQSLGNHFVVGSTLKVLTAGETHAGLDLGGMVTFGMARVGLTVRNVTEPTFGDGADALELKRQARAGFALSTGPRGVIGTGAVAVDVDLTTTVTAASGEQRQVAVGGEIWMAQRALGLRGGISRNFVGAEETSLSGGASVAFRRQKSLTSYVDGQVTGGSETPRSWSVALRLTF